MKKLTAFAFVCLFLNAILAFAGTGSPALGARSVNPQPLPPGIREALNPQPLPPGAKRWQGRVAPGCLH